MGFRNDIIGGAATLIRAAIQSPHFVHLTSGWRIGKDDSAEFQNVIIRGTINAGSFTGTTFIINSSGIFFYAGTPASGNLVASIATTAGTDSFGNTYPSGEAIGLNGSGQIQLQPNVNQAFDISTAITGVFTAMAQYYTGDVNQMMPGMFGGVLLGSGTATKMTSAWHSPFGAQGAAIVLEAQNDAGSDNPVLTFGTVSMPDGMTMVFVPILTLTPFALVLYSAGGSQVAVTKTSGSGTIPIPVGVTTAKAEVWGGGGGGGAASSASGPTPGNSGSSSTLTGTSVTVTAHPGNGGGSAAGNNSTGGGATGGSGSTNTTHNSGGAGHNGVVVAGTSATGGGGGGSGGTSAAGNTGGSPTGAVAVAGGGPGGAGGSPGVGSAPATGPGGGGGGASISLSMGIVNAAAGAGGGGEYAAEPNLAVTSGGTVSYSVGAGGAGGTGGINNGGAGKGGQVRLTYTNGVPTVGLSVNFGGSAITDQFGNSIPVGLNTTAKITTSGGEAITGGSTIDTLTVTGAASVGANLTVTGAAGVHAGGTVVGGPWSMNAGASVTGGTTTDTLHVTSTSTLNAKETITAGGLAVTGGTTTDTLTVTSTSALQGTVTLPDSETWSASGLASAHGLTGKPAITQTDHGVNTVTAASITTLTTHWAIPINDAQVGTLYRIKCYGTGQQGSTQQNLFIDGNNGNPLMQLLGTVIPVSTAFSWEAECEMRVTATGAGGTVDNKIRFSWQANVVGTTANSSTGVQVHNATAFDTTISQTVQIRANWASTTGAPTITCLGSSFERLGP